MLNGLGAHEYDYEATTEIRMFCKNNVSLYLCCHANTYALRQVYKDGEFTLVTLKFAKVHTQREGQVDKSLRPFLEYT